MMTYSSYDMPDSRLRDSISAFGALFLSLLGMVILFWPFPDAESQVQGTLLAATFVLIISLGPIAERVCHQRSTPGMSEIVIQRRLLGITWKRERIPTSEVRKVHYGWRQEQLPEKPRRLWPVRLRLQDGSLVPVAAGTTTAEAEELAEQWAADLGVPRSAA